jgi:hypothetical protein
MEDAPSFRSDDDDKFIALVTEYLEEGAGQLRGLATHEYIDICRDLWRECETDEVFKVKILADMLIWNKRYKDLKPPPGFKEVSHPEESPEDLYCYALGLIRPDGTYVGAPEGYDPTPTNPKSRRSLALAFPGKAQVDEGNEAEPASYMLALFDVLGFADRLLALGLDRMHQVYKSLIGVALEPNVAKNQWTRLVVRLSDDLFSPGIFWLPIRYAYFSDSLLFWVPLQPGFAQPFLDRVLNVFCEALSLELPLRGTVTAGTAILHKKSNTFLGGPLVEAARLHDAQKWVGAAIGVSVRSVELRIPFSPLQVMLYEAPVKEEAQKNLLSDLVLDWPRRWRELGRPSLSDTLLRLRSQGFEDYYDNALAFVRHSNENSEWFLQGHQPHL